MSRPARTTAWFTGVGLGVLAVAVFALAAAAWEHAGHASPGGTAAPVEPFHLGVPDPVGTSTPSSTPPGGARPSGPQHVRPAPVTPRADERVLVVGSVAMWRAVAGECGGAAPRLERSTDGGSSWSDVTPLYAGIERIAAIDVTTAADAEIVAAAGADCVPRPMRSFTKGEFWDAAPGGLAGWTFVAPTGASAVSTPAGSVKAPCESARGLNNRNGAPVVVCDGLAYALEAGGAWQPLPVTGVVAASRETDGVLIAHVDDSCDGIAVSLVENGATAAKGVGCVGGVPASAAVGLAEADGAFVVWAGDVFERIP